MMRNNEILKKIFTAIQVAFIAIIIVFVGFYGYLYIDNNSVKVSSYNVYSAKINYAFDDYKIIAVSDFHNSPSANKVADKIIKAQPDIVVLIGDLVSMNDETFENAEILLGRIGKEFPVYYISGNHEVWSSNHDAILEMVKSKGVNVADNQVIPITKKHHTINLIGYKDIVYADHAMRYEVLDQQLSDLFKKVEDKNLFNLMLFHRANLFNTLEKYPADLVLSGHLHNGQVNLPVFKNFILSKRFNQTTYTKGYYRNGNMQMVVSAGLSNNILEEPRIFNTPELVEVTLKSIR